MASKLDKEGIRMNITDIRVRRINAEGRMKAVVSVTFDDAFVVHDIKVIEGQDKLFIAMPSRKTQDGEFKDIAHPINVEMRESLQQAVLAKYEESLSEADETAEYSIIHRATDIIYFRGFYFCKNKFLDFMTVIDYTVKKRSGRI